MELEGFHLAELRQLAESKGIELKSGMKKAEVIAEIMKLYEKPTEKVENEEKADKAEKLIDTEEEYTIANYEVKASSDEIVEGVLDLLPDGYGFLRGSNYLSSPNDVYVAPDRVKKYNLNTGDKIKGIKRKANETDKFPALIFIGEVNGESPEKAIKRKKFDDLTPIYPNEKLRLENTQSNYSMRLMDLLCPIGKGQRGLIVAPPKAGKTTILKQIANSITENNPEVELIVLLIDERPEEVTDMKRSVKGDVIYSTFDEQPEHHVKVAEMVLNRGKQLVTQNKDVVILLDSITRLARAYNLTVPSSGKTLSGGFDPSAIYYPKRFFGAARNAEDAGSLTILATALVETGSRMDEVIFEEFKGTGNMEVKLDRSLAEKRIFPALDIDKSSTRRDDLLLDKDEMTAMYNIRRNINAVGNEQMTTKVIKMLSTTQNNHDFVKQINDMFAKNSF